MRKIKEFSIIIICSGIIGGFVGIPFSGSLGICDAFTKSAIVGMAIGLVSIMCFMFFYRNVQKNTRRAFFAVAFTIGAGTALGATYLGMTGLLHL